MVKLNVITRTNKDFERDTNKDIFKVDRVIQSQEDRLGQAVEYQRALNAAKMQKMFSQPYLFTLDEHSDGISCMAKSRENLSNIFSGSFNGEVVCWNLIKRKPVFKIDAFRNQTKEICV
jgi:WD repeat and SOF domain-containing protein 1